MIPARTAHTSFSSVDVFEQPSIDGKLIDYPKCLQKHNVCQYDQPDNRASRLSTRPVADIGRLNSRRRGCWMVRICRSRVKLSVRWPRFARSICDIEVGDEAL